LVTEMTERWEVVYEEAVLEGDRSRMEERLIAAESAIRQRLHELPLGGGTLKENLAIADALCELKSLSNEIEKRKDRKLVEPFESEPFEHSRISY
jgi:hypothetical protein